MSIEREKIFLRAGDSTWGMLSDDYSTPRGNVNRKNRNERPLVKTAGMV